VEPAVCPPPAPKKEEPEVPDLAKKAMESLGSDGGSDCQKAEKKKAMAKNAVSAIEKVEEKEKEELKAKEAAAAKAEGCSGKDAAKDDESTAALAKKALDVVGASNTPKHTCGGETLKKVDIKDLAKKALEVVEKKKPKPESAPTDDKEKTY